MSSHTDKPRCAVIGYGKVGSVLSKALVEKGYPLEGVVSRSLTRDPWLESLRIPMKFDLSELPDDLDFVILSVRDKQIINLTASIVKRGGFKKETVVAHTAGAVTAEILNLVRAVGALPLAWHPMQTFVGGEGAELLQGITFGIDGDVKAVEIGERIAADLGGVPYRVPPDKREVYHLAAVVACNLMAGLVSMAIKLLNDAGMDDDQVQKTLSPLIVKTAQNIAAKGLPHAISGPLRRGDDLTILAHKSILEKFPEVWQVYRQLSLEIMERLANREVSDRLITLLENNPR